MSSSSRLKKKSLSQEDLFNFSELFKLMKPRVMSLVIFTCAVGLLTSPGIISTKDAIIGILLVSIGAGAAGALNMWYESDLDALMTRTCLRIKRLGFLSHSTPELPNPFVPRALSEKSSITLSFACLIGTRII